MNDDELKDLFSAFDEVSTPDSMKASALDFIMAASAAGGAAVASGAAAASSTETAEAAAATEPIAAAAAEKPQFVATSAKKRKRSKWNAIRVAAIAACLALALTGGAAYALSPVSIVTITQGNTTIEVSANLFGMVSVNSNNDEGREIIGNVDISGLSLDDSVAIIRDSMIERDGSTTVTVVKRTNGALEMSQTDGNQNANANDGKPGGYQPADKQTESPFGNEGQSGESAPVDQPDGSGYDPSIQQEAGESPSDNPSDPTDEPGPIEEPGDDPIDEPEPGPIDEPEPGPIDEPEPGPIDEPIDDPIDEPGDDPIDQPDDPIDEPIDEPEPEEPPLDDQGDGDDGWEPPELYDQGFDDEPEPEPELLA